MRPTVLRSTLIERHPPDWRPEPGPRGRLGDVEIALEDVSIDGPVVSATVRYKADGRVWRHSFSARLLDDSALATELRRSGLELVRTLDERGAWLEARLYSTHSSCVTSPAV